ncbi:hypothetical protein KIL84_014533 [Mauremys mutica]|uniref:Uncharacterized protein n=1 Tax=Mauremys mutica TaxID=74926 RepID=A0A9D3XQD4_9SAUR|nr:hypothetical protein KIL84_014533 [Mauremys mutica]
MNQWLTADMLKELQSGKALNSRQSSPLTPSLASYTVFIIPRIGCSPEEGNIMSLERTDANSLDHAELLIQPAALMAGFTFKNISWAALSEGSSYNSIHQPWK